MDIFPIALEFLGPIYLFSSEQWDSLHRRTRQCKLAANNTDSAKFIMSAVCVQSRVDTFVWADMTGCPGGQARPPIAINFKLIDFRITAKNNESVFTLWCVNFYGDKNLYETVKICV